MSRLMPAATNRSKKHIANLAGHVEGAQERGNDAQIERRGRGPDVRGMQDLLLAPKPREDQWKAAQSEHPDSVSRERYRHELTQAAHLPDVLDRKSVV